ncbi:MAG: hypothetical protein L6R38_004184, partial [Xanthoria sp. 2 TBL-2021]
MDSPTTSTSSSDLPKTVIYAPEPSGLSTSYRPASGSRVAEYPIASGGTTPPNGPQQQPYGSGLYPGPRPSNPLFYNTSTTSGPTASYGTAASSGYPWSNDFLPQQPTGGSTDGLAVLSDCPPPSTITIQNTITASPTTITAPPITVTVTSTVSAKIEPSPGITPTVTLTITTTVCAGSGQNTDIGGNGSLDVTSITGGGQPGGGFPVEQGGFEPFPPPDIGIESAVVTPSPIPSFVPGGSYPQDLGSGSVNQPYQRPNSNSTGYQAPSFPETGDDQFTGIADEPKPSVERPPNTSLPPDTGADGHATSSGQPDFEEVATDLPASSTIVSDPKNIDSIISSDQDYGDASGNVGPQEKNNPYQPPAEVLSDKGQDSNITQILPELSSSQGAGIPIQSDSKPNQIESGSAFMGTSTTPPYGFNNQTISGSGFETGSYRLGTNPGTTSATEMPKPLTSYGHEGHDTSSAPYTTSNVVPPIEASVANGSGGSGIPIPSNPTDAGIYGMPPFVNSTASMSSTGINYQPTPRTAPASQGLGNLPPTTSFTPYQPEPYQTPSSNPSNTIQKIDLPTTTSDITLANQISSDTGIIYTTMTQQVVPYPMETATNSSSTPVIVSFKPYNNSPPSTTGSVSDGRGDAGDDDVVPGSTSAITSDSDPLPTSSQPQQFEPEFDTISSTSPQQPLPTLTPSSSSTVKDGEFISSSSAVKGDEPIPSSLPPPLPSSPNTTSSEQPCVPSQENRLLT